MPNYFTKEEIVRDDFLFVSYKHDDRDTVVDTVNFLLGEGVRLWYDTDLVSGDKWTTIAEGLIKHENCRGVIFFNSIPAFMSDPIYKERTYTLQKLREAQGKGTRPFLYFPVNIGEPNTMRLLKSIFARLPEDDADTDRIFPLKYIRSILELFENDVIYRFADGGDGYKAELLADIVKALPTVVDKKSLKLMPKGDAAAAPASLSLGVCRASPTTALPAAFLSHDQRAEYGGATYLVQGGHAYATKRLSWRILYTEGDVVTLIAEDTVDVRGGGPELTKWLSEDFPRLAFTDGERADILSLRLPSEKDIEKATNGTEAFVFVLPSELSETHFWLSDIKMGALQKVVKKNGTVYAAGYNFRTKLSGVRPVITMNKETLLSLY